MPLDVARVELDKLMDREVRNYEALAALETIRVNQFVPFTLTKVRHGGNDTTSQVVEFDQFEKGYVYVITSICCIDVDDAAHQILIGVKDGSTYLVFEGATVANQRDTVEYVGQLMLKETDRVYAEFRGVGAGDVLRINVNGYKIRR